MQRRQLLRVIASVPAIVGLGGCAGSMNTANPELLRGAAPSADAAWSLLPPEVRKTLTTNPAFKDTPPIGILSFSVWRHSGDGPFDPKLINEILSDNFFSQVGPIFYESSGHRKLHYTAVLGHGGMLRHASGLRIANFSTEFNSRDQVTGFVTNYLTTDIAAEGAFRLQPGSESRVIASQTAFDSRGQAQGEVNRISQTTRVEKRYGPVELWRMIAHGTMQYEAPAWQIVEPSFLMGYHYRLAEDSYDGKMRSALFSEVYGWIVAVAAPPAVYTDADKPVYANIGEFGPRMDTANHMRGNQFVLNDIGKNRLQAARVDLEAEIYRQLAVASFIPLERKTLAAPMLSNGRQLWKNKQWAEAVLAFDEGLMIDPSHVPSRLLYADALRRAYVRPTVRSLAADRLAWVSLRMAQALDPDGQGGQTARQMLSTLQI